MRHYINLFEEIENKKFTIRDRAELVEMFLTNQLTVGKAFYISSGIANKEQLPKLSRIAAEVHRFIIRRKGVLELKALDDQIKNRGVQFSRSRYHRSREIIEDVTHTGYFWTSDFLSDVTFLLLKDWFSGGPITSEDDVEKHDKELSKLPLAYKNFKLKHGRVAEPDNYMDQISLIQQYS